MANQWRKVNSILGIVENRKGQILLANKEKSDTRETKSRKLNSTSTRTKAEKLARELGETDNIPYFETIFTKFADNTIENILSKVKQVPDSKIKVSRGALFTFLLKKYAKEKRK